MNLQTDDLLFRQLARLAPLAADDVHTDSVRARCHAALARQCRNARAAAGVRVVRGWSWELVFVCGCAAIYLSAAIQQALEMYGVW
jgi:hypothetical protein